MAKLKTTMGKKRIHRTILTSSRLLSWPKINYDSEEVIIKEFNKIFSENPELKLHSKQKNVSIMNNSKAETKTQRCDLVLGINATTRCVEKGEAAAVVISNTATPSCLVEHLIVLSTIRRVPILGLEHLSDEIANIIGISCLAAFAIKKSARSNSSLFQNLLDVICGAFDDDGKATI